MRTTCGTILAAAGLSLTTNAAGIATDALVTVDVTNAVRAVKPMHAVNNGPTVKKPKGDQKCGNFEDYKAARIPFARTHDSINCVAGGAHTCDISAVFPDFDADETDPKNYDFVFTDHYLDNIRRAGTEVFFRLGQTIEHGPKKYGVLPPKDYAKWARICEHVIRHLTEGWAGGPRLKITYWEIWNEPDLRVPLDGVGVSERAGFWYGTTTQFFDLYAVAAKHLKKCFPHLKIGGPAVAGSEDWSNLFLAEMRRRKAPLDFFSWHCYAYDPAWVGARARTFREMLDRHGFRKAESILNEWNYVKGWTGEWVYSLEVESGAAKLRKVSCRVTDAWHTYTDVPAEIGADGSILLSMEPCSFVLLEW